LIRNLKKYILIFFLILRPIITQTQTETSGDPSDNPLPGGYIGISYEFDIKNKKRGYQVSLGFAMPQIGNPGQGPYLFPGIAIGNRYLPKVKKSHFYFDMQIIFFAGIWGGVGYGKAFINGEKRSRRKIFGGYLPIGYVMENLKLSEGSWESNTFNAWHLGLPLPLIGYHFHP